MKTSIVYPARILLTSLLLLWLSGCSTMSAQPVAEVPARHSVDSVVKSNVKYAVDVYDPWERMNRRIYNFNTKFDRYVFLPVVSAYEFVLPDFVEDGVSNFFSNIGELENFINSIAAAQADSDGYRAWPVRHQYHGGYCRALGPGRKDGHL